MDFIKNILKGVLMGIGAIAPGVSGGTFAVILGVYDKITDVIANFHVDFKGKVVFIFPIALGVGLGILGFSRVIKFLFDRYAVEVTFLFIGLMVGTLPSVFKEANSKGFKRIYFIPFFMTFGGTVLAMVLENLLVDEVMYFTPDFFMRNIYGVIIGLGTIVPGVSASFMLMAVGGYETVLEGIISVDIIFMLPVVIGFGVSVLIFAKLINYMFKRFYGITYYGILGFAFGSIIMITPVFTVSVEFFMGVCLFALGVFLSLRLNRVRL